MERCKGSGEPDTQASRPISNQAPTGSLFAQQSSKTWLRTWAVFVASSAAIALSAGAALGHIFTLPDTEWYLKIAQGNSGAVLQPFVVRQLGPLVCRALASVLHVSIESAFLMEGTVSLLVLLGIVGFLLLRAGVNPIMLAAVAGLTFWSELFNGLALPDLWYAALLGIFLLFLYQKRFLAAALMLFPLFLSRESTILVLFCLILVGWRRMRVAVTGVAVLASYAGMQIVKLLTAGGLSNREHLNPMLYMAGKVPWNFAKNVLGFPLWNNLNAGNCAVPQWQTSLHIGGVHTIGFCAYNPEISLWTLRLALSCFGLFPLLLIYLCLKRSRSIWTEDVLLRFCLVYGAISFFLAPELGSSVPRLFAYAWPLFVVAVPILATKYLMIPRRIVAPLLVLHLAIAWSATVNHSNTMNLVPEILMLLAVVGAYATAWMLVRQSKFA